MRRQKYRGSVESVEEALVACFAVMKVSRKRFTVLEVSMSELVGWMRAVLVVHSVGLVRKCRRSGARCRK